LLEFQATTSRVVSEMPCVAVWNDLSDVVGVETFGSERLFRAIFIVKNWKFDVEIRYNI